MHMKPFRLVLAVLLFSLVAAAQDWKLVGAPIATGRDPFLAALAPDGKTLYVVNRGTCDLTVIAPAAGKVRKTLPLGKSAKSMVISHDGSRLYVLMEDVVATTGRTCAGEAPGPVDRSFLAILDTTRETLLSVVPLQGPRWDHLALSVDDASLYLTAVYEGVYVYDTRAGRLSDSPVVRDRCPIGIAVTRDRMYVNYQCLGPGGWMSHDALAEYALPSYQRVRVFTGLANVGDQLALSPDAKHLFGVGNDACSRPDYDPEGCPSRPSRIVNAYHFVAPGRVEARTYGFSNEDANGRIWVCNSPGGRDAVFFIGAGMYLKEVETTDLDSVTRLPIANVSAVVCQADGKTAYFVVGDRNLVYTLQRTHSDAPDDTAAQERLAIGRSPVVFKPGSNVGVADTDRDIIQVRTHDRPVQAYPGISTLVLPTVLMLLDVKGSYAGCVTKDGKNLCTRVRPEDISPAIARRGDDESIRQCGEHAADRPSDTYRCVANLLLREAVAGRMDESAAITKAMQFRAMESNEQYMGFKLRLAELQEEVNALAAKPHRAPDEEARLVAARAELARQERDSRIFNDVTLTLYDEASLRAALEDSAALVAVFSWAGETYTVLVSHDRTVLQRDLDGGKPIPWPALSRTAGDFLDQVRTSRGEVPPSAQRLYAMVIGDGKVAAALEQARAQAPGGNLTLLWLTEDVLRYIPMAALSPDGRHYLVESYASAELTAPTAPEKAAASGKWYGLAAGTSSGDKFTYAGQQGWELDPLPCVPTILAEIFASATPGAALVTNADCRPQLQFAGTSKMPVEDILVDDRFTAGHLSGDLEQLARRGADEHHFFHVASHFVLTKEEDSSFLLLGKGEHLTLRQLVCADDPSCQYRFPFAHVDLVTFMACETAAGHGLDGSERESLAFHLSERGNGARAVLGTLWQICPTPSFALTQRVYGNLRGGMSKAEALRQAQLALLRAPDAGAVFQCAGPRSLRWPHSWASFILLGDWR